LSIDVIFAIGSLRAFKLLVVLALRSAAANNSPIFTPSTDLMLENLEI
jgi:hypothetical protein